jgi:hypothetical protein
MFQQCIYTQHKRENAIRLQGVSLFLEEGNVYIVKPPCLIGESVYLQQQI